MKGRVTIPRLATDPAEISSVKKKGLERDLGLLMTAPAQRTPADGEKPVTQILLLDRSPAILTVERSAGASDPTIQDVPERSGRRANLTWT
jgi:hypothetical protein